MPIDAKTAAQMRDFAFGKPKEKPVQAVDSRHVLLSACAMAVQKMSASSDPAKAAREMHVRVREGGLNEFFKLLRELGSSCSDDAFVLADAVNEDARSSFLKSVVLLSVKDMEEFLEWMLSIVSKLETADIPPIGAKQKPVCEWSDHEPAG